MKNTALIIKKTVLVVIDVQGKLAGRMCDRYYRHHICGIMKVAQTLGIPIILTEQSPDKIGNLVREIRSIAPDILPIQKNSFSCWAQPQFLKKFKRLKRKQVVIAGIQAHGCVYQTAHDFLLNKYEVFIAVDAISANSLTNKKVALHRCEREGAVLTTFEMASTELMGSARHPKFKEVMTILKHYQDTG